jgi:ABC-type Fe3+-hydroxamate transport system substrate-binding protein
MTLDAAILLLAMIGGIFASSCDRSPSDLNAAAPRDTSSAPTGGSPTSTSPIRDATPRLVVLSPALAVTLRDLGYGPNIVGRHGYDVALDPSIPVCGDQSGMDYEALLRANPTHVVLQWGERELPARLMELAVRHGWIVSNHNVLTLNDIRTSVVELDDLIGGPERLRDESAHPDKPDAGPPGARELLRRMDAAFARRRGGFAGVGRVLLLTAVTAPAAAGPGSFHHQILESIGATPAIMDGGPYQQLDVEDVVRLAPDAIVLVIPRAPRTAEAKSASTALSAPAASDDNVGSNGEASSSPVLQAELRSMLGRLTEMPIPAIRNGRVALIDDPTSHLPGTSMIALADELARILGEWNAGNKPQPR